VPKAVEPRPYSAATGRAWLAVSAFLDGQLWAESRLLHRYPSIVFTFRHRLVNSSTLTLDSLLRYQAGPIWTWMSPIPGDRRPADYFAQVAFVDTTLTMVATAPPGPDEFSPALPPGLEKLYVAHLHLHPVATYRMPDGRG
jgi:hypothetical protein